MKIENIIPIYKSDDKSLSDDYRPISNLIDFTKGFERLIWNRLLYHLTSSNILTQSQYAFRKNISIYMAILKLMIDISREIDQQITLLLLLLTCQRPLAPLIIIYLWKLTHLVSEASPLIGLQII